MQEIKNVYVDVYCIRDGMVHIFFCLGAGDAHKMNYFSALCTGSGENVGLKILCVHTKFLRGVEVGWEYVDYHGVSKYNDGW